MFDSIAQTRFLPQAKYLWFLMLLFAMIISISNWYDARLVSILGFAISPGTLSYPLSFLIADSITEVYGYKSARLAIWTALFFNLVFLLFGQLVIHLPSPSFAIDNSAFDKLLSRNMWIICKLFNCRTYKFVFNCKTKNFDAREIYWDKICYFHHYRCIS